MDRHNILGVTAKDVAMVHQEDLKVQNKYDCRALTYWFDEERGTAFCLIEAPDKKAVKAMHDDAHGLIPNQIIEVESKLVEAFLGRIEDPETSERSDDSDVFIFKDPAFRTIMVTTLKDASLIPSKSGVPRGPEFFRIHNELIRKAFRQYNGREVKHTGNGIIVSFASVSKSVNCAMEIQTRFKESDSQSSGFNMQVAIGLSAGDPVTEKDDFFGEVVQFAKRLSYIAIGGQVTVSSIVRDHYKRASLGISLEKHTIKTLNPMEEKFLNRLMDAIEKTWDQEGFNVGDFCKQIGLSRSQLYRKITSLTGYSPTGFIKEFRLRKAIKLIEKQQGNIAQIAFETGFNSPSYFSKCFKKRYDLLPSEYAKRIN